MSPDPEFSRTGTMDDDQVSYMQRLLDHVPSLLAYWDSDLRCRVANQAYQIWFGIDPERIIGMHLKELLGPQLFELNQPYIEAALQGRKQVFERIVPGPDGVRRHSLAKYLPDVVDGVVKGFVAHVTEITDLKRIEEALRASEAFLDRTGRIARVGGWEVDLQSGEQTWSDQMCRIFGIEPGYRPTSDQARQFLPPESLALMTSLVQDGMRHGTPWDIEMPVITKQGNRRWVRSIGEVVFEQGTPVRLIGASQDITEHIEHRAELAREQSLRLQLEQRAGELHTLLIERSDMLDVLAHEVRQPLHNASAALQSAQAALVNVDDQIATPRLARAQSVMTQVMAGLDNTLAAAALLGRAAPIDMEDMDIDTLMAVAIGDMAHDDRSRIVVQRHTHTRTAAMDMSLMRLALRNLLSNALKYGTPSTPVVITLADSDDPLGLLIDVSGSGPQISAQVLPTLFQRGARDRPHHGAPIGLGLGLYIVKRVMELHGGRVELARNDADGVTMRLLLTPASA